MLEGKDVNPNRKGSVTPLQSLMVDENDPNYEVDYGGSDDDYLGAFEDDENNQSQE
jgi:hypothetical protein